MAESPIITARVPADVLAKLKEEARRQRRSLSNLIAVVLEEFAGQLPASPPKGGKKS
jgi:predicted HicB family RNase H-like nuclease